MRVQEREICVPKQNIKQEFDICFLSSNVTLTIKS